MPTVGGGGWTLAFTGFQQALQAFDRLIQSGRKISGGEWFVGTVVRYAIYQHFGTRYMQGIPFFQLALDRVAQRVQSDDALRQALMEHAVEPDPDLLKQLAILLEREVKLVITEMKESRDRLIDTGVMRASFAAGPTIAETAAQSQANAGGAA